VENLDEKLKYEIITELGLFEKVSKMDGRALLQKRRDVLEVLLPKGKK